MSVGVDRKRVLFVCTQNKVRSLTAEHLYRNRPDLEVKSCGTATFARVEIRPELVKWADAIFTFDETQTGFINSEFPDEAKGKPLVCLGLADVFTYKSDALVVKLTAKLDPHLGRPNAQKCPPGSVFSKRKPTGRSAATRAPSGTGTLLKNLLSAVGVRRAKPELAK